MPSFSNGAEDTEGLDDQSSDSNRGSSTAFAYIALVRVPSIPDTSNIENENPSDSKLLKSNEYLQMAVHFELIREIRGFFFEKTRTMMSGQRYFDP